MYFMDQLGYKISLAKNPERIISLVPSLTETLIDLGLQDQVVGVTDYCSEPKGIVSQKTRVGGPKDFDPEKIADLKPDLILADQEENSKQEILDLKQDFPVWISRVRSYQDALGMLEGLGPVLGKEAEIKKLVKKIQVAFSIQGKPRMGNAVFVIWKEPLIVAGGETFITSMMDMLGVDNYFEERSRYPRVGWEELRSADRILLTNDPYPFSEKERLEIQEKIPHDWVYRVDGTMFTWYGVRMLFAAAYFRDFRSRLNRFGD